MTCTQLFLALPALVFQAGDKSGEPQPPLPDDLIVPAAPVLSPERALASFDLDDRFEIELFAAEPFVEDAVSMAFDEKGRLWTVEMRGYMPDADGNGEDQPTGFVAILEDTDGDGRIDRRINFLENLVLPRAVHPSEDGALVIAPPWLSLWRDTDGDGKADQEERLKKIGDVGLRNPEHAINSITFAPDGRYQVANASFEFFRHQGDDWTFVANTGGGQWGLGFDGRGRRYFNTNPDPLRGDLYPSRYAVRNPEFGRAFGHNRRWAHAMATYPARITPGVNRGYRKGTLREDFTLRVFTAACGPHVYEGDLRAAFGNSAFVCEPAGNLVKRYELIEKGLRLRAEPTSKSTEFLRSTDERFRPVQIATGPDGALYVLDFYRGLVQHKIFLTSFLRKQADERGLAGPIGLGRIWRIVPKANRAPRPVTLSSDSSWTDLTLALGSPNGLVRRQALRVLLEEAVDDYDAESVLSEHLSHANPLVRAGALRVLTQVGPFHYELVERGLQDPDEVVRLVAWVAGEAVFKADRPSTYSACRTALEAASQRELLQALLSLGEGRSNLNRELMFKAYSLLEDKELALGALLSGLRGAEGDWLFHVIKIPATILGTTEPDLDLVKQLAKLVAKSGGQSFESALSVMTARTTDNKAGGAIVEGFLEGRPKKGDGTPGYLHVRFEPKSPLYHVERIPEELWNSLKWPGRDDLPPEEKVRPLTGEENISFLRGEHLYADVCAACHQTSGFGEPGKAPPLRHSPWVLGDKDDLVRIVSGGLIGPIEVLGQHFDDEMPAWDVPTEDLAAVLTYLRRAWGHTADPIGTEDIERVKEQDKGCVTPWTVDSLRAD